MFMAMFAAVVAVLSGLAIQIDIVNTERWFVGNNTNCSTIKNGYSKCFASLEAAVKNLSLGRSVSNVTDITLAPGHHSLLSEYTVNCGGHKAVSIRAQNSDKETVITGTTGAGDSNVTTTSRIVFLSCVSVYISGVIVAHNSPGIMFNFTSSQNVTVTECTFINLLGLSGSFYFLNTLPVSVSNSTFDFKILALESPLVKQLTNNTKNGTRLVDFKIVAISDRFESVLHLHTALSVFNCTFKNVSLAEPSSFYGYGDLARTHQEPFQKGGLLKVSLVGQHAQYLVVTIDHCNFERMIFGYGVPVILYVADRAANNIIKLTQSSFRDNECISGCGIFSLFRDDPVNNTISVTHTNFTMNTAVVEGGAIFVLYENVTNATAPRNMFDIKRCNFQHNSAIRYFGAGSAVMIYSNKEPTVGSSESEYPLMSIVDFTDCHFISNEAVYGAVFAKNSDVHFSGSCEFMGNKGGAIYAFGSKITISGNHSITNNSRTLHGGGLSLQFWSRAIFTKVDSIVFANNNASVSGGAIYADSTSSSETYVDLLNALSGVGTRKRCFLTLDPDTRVDYEYSSHQAKIQFLNNSASVRRNDIFASTFQLCGAELLAPRQYKDYPLSGSPVSMAFVSASCKCIKHVGNQTLHIENCTRGMIVRTVESEVSKTVFASMKASVRCWNKTAASVYHRAYPNGHYAQFFNETTLYELLLVPWSNCLLSSQSNVIGLFAQRSAAKSDREICPNLSNTTRIILTPSPGERFDLNLEALDEFLQSTSTLASLTVCDDDTDCKVGTNVPPALILQAGTEYGADAQLYFDPMLPLNDLSLVGHVGATGNLRILWASYLRGFFCSLYIPFQLRKCHKGFDPPYANSNLNWTEKYIKDSRRASRPVSENSSRLKCTCSDGDGVVCDKNGRTVMVENSYWAGTLHVGKDTEEFVSHSCLGQCSHDRDVDADGYWTYDFRVPDKHCSQSRSGVLCRSCEKGYSETPAGMACHSCESWWDLGVALYVLIVAVLGIVLVSVSMRTRLLGNQYFDAWIFYIQIAPLILRPGEEMSLLHSVAHYTVSLIHFNFPLCVAPHLSQLLRFVIVAVPSLYLFFLVFILFVSSYLRRLSRYVRLERSKIGETFFVVLIVAYEPLAVFCTFTLSCTVLLGDDVRLYADPNIICFDGNHLPYSIAAICVLFALIIVPALLIYGAQDSKSSVDSVGNSNWFSLLSKACARSYTKERQWWVGITLWRRFVIAALAATITTDLTTRQLVLFSVCLAFLLFSAVVLPYRSDAANKYELLLLTNLSLIAALGINDVTVVSHTKQVSFSYIVLFLLAWPDVSIIILAIYKRCTPCWKRKQDYNETGTGGDMVHPESQTTSFTEADLDGKSSCKNPWEEASSEMRDRLLNSSFTNH